MKYIVLMKHVMLSFWCAWILWSETVVYHKAQVLREWKSETAFETKIGCDDFAIDLIRDTIKQNPSFELYGLGYKTKTGNLSLYCLPDTIDPRK